MREIRQHGRLFANPQAMKGKDCYPRSYPTPLLHTIGLT
jgi:hypothetical protein